jgi:hypothetical protein
VAVAQSGQQFPCCFAAAVENNSKSFSVHHLRWLGDESGYDTGRNCDKPKFFQQETADELSFFVVVF